MRLLVNLRHLEAGDVHLAGKMSREELDIDSRDEVIQVTRPLEYDVVAQKIENGILAQGRLRLPLECHCVRCLRPFEYELELKRWTCHLPLRGEEAVSVANDCVDLTPFMREDILLEFPQHPLCNRECGGLPNPSVGPAQKPGTAGKGEAGSSAWAELNKLKF